MSAAPRARLSGRADLLRLLAAAGDAASGDRLAAALGFEPKAGSVPWQRRGGRLAQQPVDAGTLGAWPSAPLRAELVGALLVPEPPPPEQEPAPAEPLSRAPRLQPQDWGPAPQPRAQPFPWRPIAPAARAVPALGRSLQTLRPGPLDEEALADQWARLQPNARPPRRSVGRVASDWVLVLDTKGELRLFLPDMVTLLRWSARALMGAGASVREPASPDDPNEGYLEVVPARSRSASAMPRSVLQWHPLPAGTQVVLVSDLGMAASASGLIPWPWRQWMAQVLGSGARLTVWSPVPLRAVLPDALEARISVVHWSAASNLRPAPLPRGRAHHTPARQRQADAILTRLAHAPWIDAPLVRAMRCALGEPDAGIEQLVWSSHALTRGQHSRRPRQEALEALRNAFEQLPAAARREAAEVIAARYARFSQPLLHMHALAWYAADPQADPRAAPVQAARSFFQRLAANPRSGGRPPAEVALFLRAWLDHAGPAEQQVFAPLRAEAWKALRELDLGVEALVCVPQDLPHAWLADAHRGREAPQPRHLVHDSVSQRILLVAGQPAPGMLPLLPAPLAAASADLQAGATGPRSWLELDGAGAVVLGPAPAEPGLTLRLPDARVFVGRVERPRGVVAWHRDAGGLHLRGAALGATALVAEGEAVELLRGVHGLQVHVPGRESPGGGPRFGIDEFGLWAELVFAGVVQRFRWLEPGEFWMGSPEDEPGRYDDEGPRHVVRLTRGLWLADSACTRALWEAVAGKSALYFSGHDRCPVERVSWDEVRYFLARLQRELPAGVEAVLPTEAQWEYACRAGTQTAFSFGPTVDPSQVNYDGDYPYAGGPLGEKRGRTVAVKSLPPNGWGLYEMHGNVWEWCADGPRAYDASAQEDPVGPAGDERAVRGGSWIDDGRDCRAALRRAGAPGVSYHDQGFRFALRSIESGKRGERAAKRPAPARRRRAGGRQRG